MAVAQCVADGGWAGATRVGGVPLLRALRGDVCRNARTLLASVPRPRAPPPAPAPSDTHPAHRDPAASDSQYSTHTLPAVMFPH